MNILGHFGFNLVVVPHWNNAEGGNHDTRFCFMGEPRFKKLESLPWGTYGGIIGEHDADLQTLTNITSRIISLRQPILEIALDPSGMQSITDESRSEMVIRKSATHILNLSDSYEELWSNHFQPRNRTAIRRAQKQGVQVRWSNDPEAISNLKKLYENACSTWEGVETLPLEFFDHLTGQDDEKIRVWFAYLDNDVLAADVMLYGKGEIQYFTGAGDRRFSSLNGSKLLMSEIIRDASQRNFSSLNFGASSGLSGVEQFKRHFGATEVETYRLICSLRLLRFFGVGDG